MEPLTSGLDLPASRIPLEKVLKALAMYTIGLPMDRIEQRLGIKGETVKKYVVCCATSQLWPCIREVVVRGTGIVADDLTELDLLEIELKVESEVFRRRAYDFRRRPASERRRIERRSTRIASLQIPSSLL